MDSGTLNIIIAIYILGACVFVSAIRIAWELMSIRRILQRAEESTTDRREG